MNHVLQERHLELNVRVPFPVESLLQVAPPLLGTATDRPEAWIIGLAVVSIALVAINMFGGFAVTQRMLQMFRR